MKTVLGIFCKHPIPGKVKTRLAKAIGDDAAARLYEAFLLDVVARFRPTDYERFLSYAPNEVKAGAYFASIGKDDYVCVPQVEGNLGDRMAAFFRDQFATGAQKVIVIGSDCPTINCRVIGHAAELLGRWRGVEKMKDAVLGRSGDGGYFLLGLSAFSEGLFDRIDWSTSAVYTQQTTQLLMAEYSVHPLVAHPPEVDTIEDLECLLRHKLLATCTNTCRVIEELDLR